MKQLLAKSMFALSLLSLSTLTMAYDKNDERIIDQNMQIVVNSINNNQLAPIFDVMPPKVLEVIA